MKIAEQIGDEDESGRGKWRLEQLGRLESGSGLLLGFWAIFLPKSIKSWGKLIARPKSIQVSLCHPYKQGLTL